MHLKAAHEDKLPLIRRFSGGGTVYVDDNCKMVSLIVNQQRTRAHTVVEERGPGRPPL